MRAQPRLILLKSLAIGQRSWDERKTRSKALQSTYHQDSRPFEAAVT